MNRSTGADAGRSGGAAATFIRAAPSATTASVRRCAQGAAQHIGVADERRDETLAGPVIDFLRGAELANASFRHDREAVGQV